MRHETQAGAGCPTSPPIQTRPHPNTPTQQPPHRPPRSPKPRHPNPAQPRLAPLSKRPNRPGIGGPILPRPVIGDTGPDHVGSPAVENGSAPERPCPRMAARMIGDMARQRRASRLSSKAAQRGSSASCRFTHVAARLSWEAARNLATRPKPEAARQPPERCDADGVATLSCA
jgi:hypothetical protein